MPAALIESGFAGEVTVTPASWLVFSTKPVRAATGCNHR
jgi:hypothetical protein